MTGQACGKCVGLALVVGAVLAVLGRGDEGKTQTVRVVDVLLLAPFLVWAGATGGELPRGARFALIAAGAATAVFNGLNWVNVQRG